MNDTSPEVERRYRELLLHRSGDERLKMGSSVHAAARRLVIASVLENEPGASPATLRRALFLRFYGHEFPAAARERILAALEDCPFAVEPRYVPVDWDELELALTMQLDEWVSYLDVRTGQIRTAPRGPFAGEHDDGEPSEEELEAGLADGTLIAIEPLSSSKEYGWMVEFADTVRDPRLRRSLEAALHRRRPFRGFKGALAGQRRELERWFAFRDERLLEAIREWLADNGIEPTTPPPGERQDEGA